MNTPRSSRSRADSLPNSHLESAIHSAVFREACANGRDPREWTQPRFSFDGRENASSVGNLSYGPASVTSSRRSKARSHSSAVTPRDVRSFLSQHQVDRFVAEVEVQERARLLQAFQGDGILPTNQLWECAAIRELVTTIVKTRGLIAQSNAKVRLSQGSSLPDPKSQIPSLKMNPYKQKASNKRKPQDVLLNDLLKLEFRFWI